MLLDLLEFEKRKMSLYYCSLIKNAYDILIGRGKLISYDVKEKFLNLKEKKNFKAFSCEFVKNKYIYL